MGSHLENDRGPERSTSEGVAETTARCTKFFQKDAVRNSAIEPLVIRQIEQIQRMKRVIASLIDTGVAPNDIRPGVTYRNGHRFPVLSYERGTRSVSIV